VLEYIGTFELPVDKALYHFHRMLSRIKHWAASLRAIILLWNIHIFVLLQNTHSHFLIL
jgi:hypothetical protein